MQTDTGTANGLLFISVLPWAAMLQCHGDGVALRARAGFILQ